LVFTVHIGYSGLCASVLVPLALQHMHPLGHFVMLHIHLADLMRQLSFIVLAYCFAGVLREGGGLIVEGPPLHVLYVFVN